MALKPLLAAFVAVTVHVATDEAVKEVPLIEQPVPLTEKLTAPVPEPPDVAREIVDPGMAVNVVFEIVKVD
jgi:hypothetical protein